MITTRDATAADLPAIDRVFRRSFCDTFAHLYRPDDLASFLAQFTPEAWAEEYHDPGYRFRVAEADGVVVAFVKLGPVTLPAKTTADAWELRQFYVLKQWHGAGIAAELMDWALAEAARRGVGELFLSVFTDNHRARRFYARHGFVDFGRYQFMVGTHADDEIIMKRSF